MLKQQMTSASVNSTSGDMRTKVVFLSEINSRMMTVKLWHLLLPDPSR